MLVHGGASHGVPLDAGVAFTPSHGTSIGAGFPACCAWSAMSDQVPGVTSAGNGLPQPAESVEPLPAVPLPAEPALPVAPALPALPVAPPLLLPAEVVELPLEPPAPVACEPPLPVELEPAIVELEPEDDVVPSMVIGAGSDELHALIASPAKPTKTGTARCRFCIFLLQSFFRKTGKRRLLRGCCAPPCRLRMSAACARTRARLGPRVSRPTTNSRRSIDRDPTRTRGPRAA